MMRENGLSLLRLPAYVRGYGLRARCLPAATARPFDPAAMAAMPSPAASITLEEAGALLVSQAEALGGGGPVRAVAHSMGALC